MPRTRMRGRGECHVVKPHLPGVPAPGELDPGPRRPPARGEHTLLAQ